MSVCRLQCVVWGQTGPCWFWCIELLPVHHNQLQFWAADTHNTCLRACVCGCMLLNSSCGVLKRRAQVHFLILPALRYIVIVTDSLIRHFYKWVKRGFKLIESIFWYLLEASDEAFTPHLCFPGNVSWNDFLYIWRLHYNWILMCDLWYCLKKSSACYKTKNMFSHSTAIWLPTSHLHTKAIVVNMSIRTDKLSLPDMKLSCWVTLLF